MPKSKRTHCRKELSAVHAVLKEKLRQAGPGAIRDTENELFYRGYIRYHRHRQELDLGALLAILKRLDIRPLDFFAEVANELGENFDAFDNGPEGGESEPPDPTDSDSSSGTPYIEALTARAVLRRVGADLPVYGDFDE